MTFTLWIYAIGTFGQERISELGLRTMNVKLFKVNVIVLGALFLFILFLSATQQDAVLANKATDTFEPKDIINIIAGAYFVFAVFQTIIFTCKTIAKIELRREVSSSDYFTNLLLMFFFFIGIWILQPKINRLIVTKGEEVSY